MRKIIIIFMLLLPLCLVSKWSKYEGPKTLQTLAFTNGNDKFLVAFANGISFSFDNGLTWEKRVNGLPDGFRKGHSDFIFNNGIIYVNLSYGKLGLNSDQGIFYTTDYGLNWKEIEIDTTNSLFKNSRDYGKFYCIDSVFYLLPTISSHITKIKDELTGELIETKVASIIYSTDDFGKTWEETELVELDDKFFRLDMVYANKDTLIGIEFTSSGGDCPPTPVVSVDGGISWEIRNNGLDNCRTYAVAKLDGKRIFIGYSGVGLPRGFFYSEDLGESWNELKSLSNISITKIEVMNGHVLLATESNGLIKLSADLSSWESLEFFEGKRIRDIYWNGEYLFVQSSDEDYFNANQYRTKDLETFERIGIPLEISYSNFAISNSKIYFGSLQTSLNSIYAIESLNNNNYVTIANEIKRMPNLSTTHKNIVYFNLLKIRTYDPVEFMLSKDYGNTFETIQNNELSNVTDVQLINEDTILVRSNGWYISSDCGKTFTEFQLNDSTLNKEVSKYTKIKRVGDKIFLYGSEGIYETNEKLNTWNLINTFEGVVKDFSIFKDTIYTINSKDNQFFILKSIDYGKTWENINSKFLDYEGFSPISVFNFGESVFVSSNLGIFISKDNGESWEELNDGLVDYSGNGEFALFGKNILYLSSKGINYQSLSELGINLTSVDNPKIECKNLKEIEYYDLLGNKLLPSQIFNKRILVKYQCLETGEYINKLEFREK